MKHHVHILLVLLAACEAAAPAHPTYDEDVAPIVEANCVRCHAAPITTHAALQNCVRLDRWDTVLDSSDLCNDSALAGKIFGVRDAGPMMVMQVQQHIMPKDGPALDQRQITIFERWMTGGFPRHANNHPPTIAFTAPPATGVTVCNPNCTTTVAYTVSDPDGDSVTWTLGWSGNGGTGTFATGLTDGTGMVVIDATPLASGTYTLVATLDDGSSVTMAQGPTLTVPAGHNAPPAVTVVSPNGGESYYQGATVAISWVGNDPDDATLSYDVEATQGTTLTPIATGIVAPVGQTAMTTWTAPQVSALTTYRIRVTATDGGSPALTAVDTSDADFTISPPPQNVSFSSQLQPIFTASCAITACHSGVHPQQGLDLSAGKAYAQLVNVVSTECAAYKLVLPSSPDQSYLIFKLQGSGACYTGSQMPKGAAPLSAAQQQLFRDWIANGAPNN